MHGPSSQEQLGVRIGKTRDRKRVRGAGKEGRKTKIEENGRFHSKKILQLQLRTASRPKNGGSEKKKAKKGLKKMRIGKTCGSCGRMAQQEKSSQPRSITRAHARTIKGNGEKLAKAVQHTWRLPETGDTRRLARPHETTGKGEGVLSHNDQCQRISTTFGKMVLGKSQTALLCCNATFALDPHGRTRH